MRRHVFLVIAAALPLLAACGTTPEPSPFAQPNSLMAEEITNRIEEIPFQQGDELIENLLWLAETGESAIPAVLMALDHENPKVRSNSVWVLSQMADRRTIPHVQRLTNDPDPRVRLEVARTLVLMGDMGQTAVLIEGLDSEHREVRFMCHEALKTSSKRDFGYDHLSADITERFRAAHKWRQWWSEISGDPYFAQTYADEKGLTPPETDPTAAPQGLPAAPAGETVPPKAPSGTAGDPNGGTNGSAPNTGGQ